MQNEIGIKKMVMKIVEMIGNELQALSLSFESAVSIPSVQPFKNNSM